MRCFLDSKQSNEQRKDRLTEEIKAAYGFSDEQLIREMDDAIAHPDTSPELQAPENEFQLIMKKVEEMMKRAERQATPRISGVAGFTGTFPPARRRRKKMTRMLLVAALLGVIGVGGVVSIGRSRIQYREVEWNGMSTGIAWNNVKTVEEVDSNLERAYEQISEKLQIPVVGLKYVPYRMKFTDIAFIEQGAVISFDYNGYIVHLSELSSFSENANMHGSDRLRYDEKYHRILDETIIFCRNELDNGKTEFGAEITTDMAYYYLSGVMEENEFKKMVEGLYFYQK